MSYLRKPEWLKIKLERGASFTDVSNIVKDHKLETICSSGKCPNMHECWSCGTATFMVLGDTCTRSCKFCATKSGKPLPPDTDEPQRLAESIQLMKLRYAVITSVDRDDLPDGGAAHWAACIKEVKQTNPNIKVEVLIPDFDGHTSLIDVVLAAKPNVVAHNVETIARLTPLARSRARYQLSLDVLRYIASTGMATKTGIMVGLGETEAEVIETMQDAFDAGCSIFTIGQYLQPTQNHLPVVEYVHPDIFKRYEEEGKKIGLKQVVSGPLVRSSYHAADFSNQ